MAAHKSTRSRDEKTPLKGGNRIRTHPRRVASAEGKSSSPSSLPPQKRRRGSSFLPDQTRFESMKEQLAVVLSGVATCALALEQQRADRDIDVASTLKGFVAAELWRIHGQMSQLEFARPVRRELKLSTR